MEALGTITKYFPFIEPEKQEIIEQIMETAVDYSDFVDRLATLAYNEDVPSVIAYLAVNHAVRLRDYRLIDMLAEKYSESDKIRPIILFARALRGEESAIERVLPAADLVIITYPEAWIHMDMYDLKHTFYRLISVTKYDEMLENALAAEELLRNDESLRCMASFIYTAKGWALFNLARADNVMEYFGQTLVIARKCNDKLATADALFGLRTALAGHDTKREMSILKEASDIYKEMGHSVGESFVLDHMAEVYSYLGDFESALECYLESVSIKNEIGLEHAEVLSAISRLYASLGDADMALKYSTSAIDSSRKLKIEHPAIYYDMARALMLKGEYEEAFDYLETGGELAFEIGADLYLGSYYFHRGILYRDRENFSFAVQTLKRALKIAERSGNIQTIVKSLVRIAEAEVAMFVKNNEPIHITRAELAIARIEQIAKEQGFQSLLVEVALLRAEIQLASGQELQARSTLMLAKSTAESADLPSLANLVTQRLDQIGSEEFLDDLTRRFKEPARRIKVPIGQAKSIPFKVLGCLVMHQDSGLDVYSRYVDERLEGDTGLVAGLITAVSAFAKELRHGAKGQLQSIVHQDIAVLLEHGSNSMFALLTDKDTYEARVILRRFIDSFERVYGDVLSDWHGENLDLTGIDEIFDRIIIKRKF